MDWIFGSDLPAHKPWKELVFSFGRLQGPTPVRPYFRVCVWQILLRACQAPPKLDPDFGPYLNNFTESLILAQDERWRRA
jgi:hypothetical protein